MNQLLLLARSQLTPWDFFQIEKNQDKRPDSWWKKNMEQIIFSVLFDDFPETIPIMPLYKRGSVTKKLQERSCLKRYPTPMQIWNYWQAITTSLNELKSISIHDVIHSGKTKHHLKIFNKGHYIINSGPLLYWQQGIPLPNP